MRKAKLVAEIIITVLLCLFIIYGSTVLLMRTHTYQTPVNAQNYYDYVVYINRDTHEAYLYEHGQFIPLYGADDKPIVININE